MRVRRYLHREGFRYTIDDRRFPGRPDLAFPKLRAVVFVHGCFWHQHPNCKLAAKPGSNVSFWRIKLAANVERDRRNSRALRRLGWHVFTVWECQIRDSRLASLAASLRALSS